MLIQTQQRKVSSGGLGDVRHFQMAATAKAFKITIDGLYTNKIGAIVREYSTNAQDANPSRPFNIHLPTILNPNFIVRDFGPGLDDDGIDTFITIFASTKENTNSETGMLGLGCKSAFSKVDQFTVISYHKGMKTVYLMYLDENRVPSMRSTPPVRTNEPSGLEVVIPVSREDITKYRDEAKRQLKYFNPQPVFSDTTFEFSEEKCVFEKDHVKFFETNMYGSRGKWTVIQGPVGYPIDLTELKLDSSIKNFTDYTMAEIKVPMGTCDVAASREALSYDERTITNLKKYVTEACETYKKESTRAVTEAATYWDALTAYAKMVEALPWQLKNLYKHLSWNGKALTQNITIGGKCYELSRNWMKSYRSSFPQPAGYLHLSEKTKLFLLDTDHRPAARLSTYISNLSVSLDDVRVIAPDMLPFLPQGYPVDKIVKISSLPVPPVVRGKSPSVYRSMRLINHRGRLSGDFNGPRSVDYWTSPLTQNPTSGYYLISDNNCTYNMHQWLNDTKLIPGDVYLVQKSAANKIKDLPLKDFTITIKEAVKKCVEDNKLLELYDYLEAYSVVESHFFAVGSAKTKTHKNKELLRIQELCNIYRNSRRLTSDEKKYVSEYLVHNQHSEDAKLKHLKTAEDALDAFVTKYPLLSKTLYCAQEQLTETETEDFINKLS